MGLIAVLRANRLGIAGLHVLERAGLTLLETTVYEKRLGEASLGESNGPDGLNFVVSDRPQATWDWLRLATSQHPSEGERGDIWITAKINGAVAGTVALAFRRYYVVEAGSFVNFPEGYLFGLFVPEELRGKGIAGALIRQAEAQVRGMKPDATLHTLVACDNTISKVVFEKQGYAPVWVQQVFAFRGIVRSRRLPIRATRHLSS